MIRTFSIAAIVAVAAALPATAEQAEGPVLQNLMTEHEARAHLIEEGYTEVSSMIRHTSGAWIGTATTADGERRIVGVNVQGPSTERDYLTN